MSWIACSLIIGKIVNTQICIRTLTLRPLKLIALLRRTGKEWRRPVLITRSLTHQLNIDWQHSPPDNPQTADPPALATIAANNGSLRTIEVHKLTRQLTNSRSNWATITTWSFGTRLYRCAINTLTHSWITTVYPNNNHYSHVSLELATCLIADWHSTTSPPRAPRCLYWHSELSLQLSNNLYLLPLTADSKHSHAQSVLSSIPARHPPFPSTPLALYINAYYSLNELLLMAVNLPSNSETSSKFN